MSEKTEQTETKEYPKPPDGIRVLKNGAGYDMVAKKIAYAPGTFGPAPKQIVTSERGKELNKIRQEKTKERIRAAIVEQAQAHALNVNTPQDAIGIAAGALFGDVLEGKGTLRDRNKVTWDIAKYTELLDIQTKQGGINQTNVQINLTNAVLDDILRVTDDIIIDVDGEV